MRRIFQRFAETRSLSRVAKELNDDGIPSHCGRRWCFQAIRRTLRRESYTGRFIYGRTKVARTGGSKSGKRQHRQIRQPTENWTEVKGASPRIVDEALWQRVQEILEDPERPRIRPATRPYAVRGRAKCGICGSAMVGQTLTARGQRYSYYRCRHIYDKNTSRECSARFVRADELERGVWEAIKSALNNPLVVLHELEQRQLPQQANDDEVAQLEREIASMAERERRLVRLFAYGEVDEAVIREEVASLKRQLLLLQERLNSLRPAADSAIGQVSPETLSQVCAAVADWLDRASERDRAVVLEALQISVTATREAATIAGVLPVDVTQFITGEPSSAPGCGGTARGVGSHARRTGGPRGSAARPPTQTPAPARRRRS